MIDSGILLNYIILFAALAVPGYLLGRTGKLNESAFDGMTVILTDVAMPCLVFVKLLETDLCGISLFDAALAFLFPFFISLVLWGISLLLFRRKADRDRQSARFCAIFSNCGFLGIPLADAAFPDSPQICSFVAIFNVSSTFILLTLGIYILSGDRKHVSLRGAIFKPVTLAVVLGVILSLAGVGTRFGGIALYSEILAALTTPLAMLVLGAQTSRIPIKEIFFTPSLYLPAAVKLVISPLITLGALTVLSCCGIDVSRELAVALFISTGVSTAATASAMAKRYGASGRYAAILTLGSTMLCAVTLPLLSLLYKFIF